MIRALLFVAPSVRRLKEPPAQVPAKWNVRRVVEERKKAGALRGGAGLLGDACSECSLRAVGEVAEVAHRGPTM